MEEALLEPIVMDKAEPIQSVNPNTGEILGSVPVCGEGEVREAVGRARAAQPDWAARTLAERVRMMRRIQEALVDRADEITSLVSREMGKSETETIIGDVLLVLTSLTGYINLAPKVLRVRRQSQGLLHITKCTYVVPEPLGVVAVISPYNFPVLLTMQTAFAALLAGNAVVHKPSEYASLTALRLREILLGSGLPEDLFQVVTGGGRTGWALANAGVDHIAFTGGCAAGRKLAQAAGAQLIPATLELGGNNAMIVFDDAPLARTVDGALTYAYIANGQVCGSVARIYVHEAVADEFLRRLKARAAEWKVSTETAPGASDVTALIHADLLARVEGHVREAVADGARVLTGGGRLAGTAAPVYRPTILVDTRPEMAVVREESFGPLLCVIRVQDDEEAVRLANDTEYGLTASVWSRSDERAWRAARKLKVGTVAVNDHLWPFFAPEVPWGGVKASGLGRIGGEWGLRAMTYPKVVSYDRINLPREFYWSPRAAWVHEFFRQAVPLLYSRRIGRKLKALGRLMRMAGRPFAG
ncbi:MAG: aldehyde dehydrogenase family protein [Anaerolineales bacterium]|nr:aldehyde dehydrogenase family protein [Anaerolineales bacterium]